ncbi:MAG: MlaD family protein [Helicobacteraceae bacterium]|nr:MlaD family protein [Helicobacteraceae bacterium]
MERGVNYIIIGLCFILSLLGLIIFIFWFSDSGLFKDDVRIYKSYTKRPLNIKADSLVKYKGINVGKVKDIKFRDNDFEEIEIILEILKELPIKKDSTIKVEQDGLFGGSYISLIQNESQNQIITDQKDAVLMISSDSMTQILEAIPSITGKVDYLLDSANKILSVDNAKYITAILLSIQEASNNINSMIKSLNKNTNEIDSILQSVNKITSNTEKVIENINKKVQNGEYDLKTTLAPTLMSIESALDDISKLSKSGSNLLNDLEENPYNTIFGYREEKK